ncbi:MAG TPA: nucleoside phosphorylase [Candidatus Polarisedimenticolaceae bacterium]|nr:nucleoside phosphorylase [Candidatus Polarisedimenticolaceae bacterium]
MSIPILEHDPAPTALIEPTRAIQPRDVPEHCVICFFREVIDKVVADHRTRLVATQRWEDGDHPVYETTHLDRRLAFFHPGVGAPLAAGLLEEVIALGCRKFIACGGCGVLEHGIAVGAPIIVTSAVRDEGVSYHYLPPGREVIADETAIIALANTLDRRGTPYRRGKTWTTDAPYRETAAKIARRKDEGCIAVEMECAALTAVARFRNVAFGQLLYGGDDLSGADHDARAGQSREQARERLFWLCADACLAL